MLIHRSKKIKTITAGDAFDFDNKLNSFTDSLDLKGIPYTVSVNPSAGLLAFVEYEVTVNTPENAKDEYELLGERHTCIECPFYVRPTDGRVKYTKCSLQNCLTDASQACCEQFYERLKRGMELTNMANQRWTK